MLRTSEMAARLTSQLSEIATYCARRIPSALLKRIIPHCTNRRSAPPGISIRVPISNISLPPIAECRKLARKCSRRTTTFSRISIAKRLLRRRLTGQLPCIAAYLLKEPYGIDLAGNGRITGERFQAERYCLVLLDIQTPEMGGARSHLSDWPVGERTRPRSHSGHRVDGFNVRGRGREAPRDPMRLASQ
jgi:hypothetical protein